LRYVVDSRDVLRRARLSVLAVAGVLAIGLLLVTAAVELPRTIDRMRTERAQFVSLTHAEREQAFGTLIPLRMDVFGFYRSHLRPGDRYWIQVDASPFSEFANKATVVRGVGRMALLPAVEVERPEQADVILSWDKDPALLQYRYSEQWRAGLQLLFVSRVAHGR
jgi:hypothetical protein